ncbi:hypothetical protein BJ508DRAFT_360132 [Ascobolus immersus RN42]|uniref:Uncharacterized protein n=1 Tax=Ascobolus immersus RN42 TaxID=1160509 RepID=A0A3N4ICH8_ASCIM|nr:hypothetical protein BJ508DRAFT_360132 [Ascobolus immersus RN42]
MELATSRSTKTESEEIRKVKYEILKAQAEQCDLRIGLKACFRTLVLFRRKKQSEDSEDSATTLADAQPRTSSSQHALWEEKILDPKGKIYDTLFKDHSNFLTGKGLMRVQVFNRDFCQADLGDLQKLHALLKAYNDYTTSVIVNTFMARLKPFLPLRSLPKGYFETFMKYKWMEKEELDTGLDAMLNEIAGREFQKLPEYLAWCTPSHTIAGLAPRISRHKEIEYLELFLQSRPIVKPAQRPESAVPDEATATEVDIPNSDREIMQASTVLETAGQKSFFRRIFELVFGGLVQ